MKKPFLIALICCTITTPVAAQDEGDLTGDIRLACEAILCLSSGLRPRECAPSLARYFGISMRRWGDTLRARISFLRLCPAVGMDAQMQSLVNAIATGAGRCDAAYLNATQTTWRADGPMLIANSLPTNCGEYVGHAYTDLQGTLPRYVGVPERGGFWADAADYDLALRQYNARIATEDAARRYEGN